MPAPKSGESKFWAMLSKRKKSGEKIEIKNNIEDKIPKEEIAFETSFGLIPILNRIIRATIEKLTLWAINEPKIDWLYM